MSLLRYWQQSDMVARPAKEKPAPKITVPGGAALQLSVDAASRFLHSLKSRGVQAFDLIGSAGYLPAERCHDIDFLILTTRKYWKLAEVFVEEFGFEEPKSKEADGYGEGDFRTFRKGKLNLILCEEPIFYRRYYQAYLVCKALKVEDKYSRVLVHSLVRDEMTLEEAQEAAAGHTADNVVRREVRDALLVVTPMNQLLGRQK